LENDLELYKREIIQKEEIILNKEMLINEMEKEVEYKLSLQSKEIEECEKKFRAISEENNIYKKRMESNRNSNPVSLSNNSEVGSAYNTQSNMSSLYKMLSERENEVLELRSQMILKDNIINNFKRGKRSEKRISLDMLDD
jgi:hypothetical protein